VFSVVVELWSFLRVRKKLWLFPLILWLGIVIGLVVAAQSSAIGPYIYSLF
jgi:hypothetical protein